MQVNHNRFLGYTKDDEGNLIIEPTEATVIKRIYGEYLEGASYNIEQASIKKRILESKRYGHPGVEGGIILFFN